MSATSEASQPTSLKLPAALKAQLSADAQNAGLSLHAFMIQTLADAARRIRLRDNFAQDAKTALDEMKASGLGYVSRPAPCDHFSQAQRESGYTASEL